MSNDDFIDLFLESFEGVIAVVTAMSSRKILACNKSASLAVGGVDIIGKTIDELIEGIDSPLIKAELIFCSYVENECIKQNSTMMATENFNGNPYISMRTKVKYQGEFCVLAIIVAALNCQEYIKNARCNVVI